MTETNIPTSHLAISFPNPLFPYMFRKYLAIVEAGEDTHPIQVYTAKVDENDLGSEELLLSGERIDTSWLGETLYYIEDGYHRAVAYQQVERDTIPAIITD